MQYQRIYVGLVVKLHFLKKIISLLVILILFTGAFAQTNPDSLVVKIDSLSNSLNIEKNMLIFIDSSGHLPLEKIASSKFTLLTGFEQRNKIPGRLLVKPFYLQFTLQNASAALNGYYLYPGIHYDHISLYKKNAGGGFEKVEQPKTGTGFVYLATAAGQTITYLLKLEFTKTENGRLTAVIMTPEHMPDFILELTTPYGDKRIASYMLCGILFIITLFTLVNFFLTYKIEFLYHCFFSICMFFLIFFSAYLSKRPGWFSSFFIGYLDLMLLIVGTIFYLAFIRKFLNTKNKHLVLDKLFKAEAWILTLLMFVFTYIHYQTDDIMWGKIIENFMKILALLIGMVFIVKGLKHKDRLMQYLAMGSAAQIFFSIISLLMIFSGQPGITILRSPLFYFELGVVMAIFFFLLGLTYKNRRELIEKTQGEEAMKLEVEKKVFETKLAVINAQQEERNRISADMHDDLGSGMTTIRLFSELAKAKMGDRVMPEIEKISASADELLNKMNAIIWSMSSSNDSLGNLVAYIRSYAQEYFENTGIDCKITLPDHIPELVVSGIIRRNVFLVIKEALTNIVKYSEATEVRITLQQEEKGYSLLIHDNGIGIDFDNIRQFGNGLKNMKKRMDDVGIEFSIEKNHGTLVRLYREVLAWKG